VIAAGADGDEPLMGWTTLFWKAIRDAAPRRDWVRCRAYQGTFPAERWATAVDLLQETAYTMRVGRRGQDCVNSRPEEIWSM
jgi:hypothetical protein